MDRILCGECDHRISYAEGGQEGGIGGGIWIAAGAHWILRYVSELCQSLAAVVNPGNRDRVAASFRRRVSGKVSTRLE